MNYHTDELIAALATPRGRGAIAVLRTSGPECIETVARVFSRPDQLTASEGYRVHHGWILDGKQRRVDEVLLTVFRSPASYTGQDSVEISCHGGQAVSSRILEILKQTGFRDAAPGEFTFRAFMAGKMDLTQAEAVREIIDSRTFRAASRAASRLAGSVVSVINQAKDAVRHQAAAAALVLDYPDEEEVTFDTKALTAATRSLKNLINTWNTGKLCRDGLKLTLAGPANAGKSSLFNLFVKEERSIVTEQPGTTRDWVEAWISIGGIPVQLRDTAGLRSAPRDQAEAEGIRRSRQITADSDLILAVADGTQGNQAARECEKLTGPGSRTIRIWNKSDLAPDIPDGWIGVSALTGAGFADLENEILTRVQGGPDSPEPEAPVDSLRQKELLERSVAALERFDAGAPADLAAEDLREALDALGELTGEVTRTDVLNTLFAEFCVGK